MVDNIEVPDDWVMPAINWPRWMPEPDTLVVGDSVYAALAKLAEERGVTVDELVGMRVVKVTHQ